MKFSFKYYTILLTTCFITQTIHAQSITITNPQMGWTWNYASNVTVEWDYTGFSGNVAIDIYKGETNQIRIISSVDVSKKRIDFIIPNSLQPDDDYRVGISATPSGDPWNFSDEFAIRKLEVTYPNGGQNFYPSNVINVTWNYNTVTSNIAIDLYKGDINIQRIISNTSVYDGNENVTIPSTALPGNDYKIALSGHGGYVYDFSDNYFTISEASTRIINLSGDMNFGSVQVGQTSQRTLTISNSGNSTLTVSSISYPTGFSGNWSGIINSGKSIKITVTFAPAESKNYSGYLIVYSNKTSGSNSKQIYGLGTNDLFTINLKVPFKAQTPPPFPRDWENTLNCGQTCCAMVFSYYEGDIPTVEDIIAIDDWLFTNYEDPINNYCGSTTDISDLVNIAKFFAGYSESSAQVASDNSLAPLINELRNNYPVIVAVRINMQTETFGHFMVLCGIDEKFVYVNDPGKSLGSGLGMNMKYSKEQFIQSWSTQNNSYVTIHGNKLGGSVDLNSPQNLVYEKDDNNIILGWETPYNEGVISYNIYRNDTKIATINNENNLYFDYNLQYNTEYLYYITANFNNCESESSNRVLLTLSPLTSVEKLSMKLNKFELLNNYPNPFNPITTITYSISKTQNVVLNIFNTQGQLIETLVNSIQLRNIYKIDWDASCYVSGLYFINIKTDTFCDVKKCLLLK